MNIRLHRQISGAIAVLLLGACAGPDFERIQGQTMGTYYAVQYRPSQTCAVSLSELDAALVSINASMSTYDPDSELSRLNRRDGAQWLPVSVELAEVLAAAETLWRRSEGAFDVTVGPLVNLWGFGPQADLAAPTAGAQAAAAAIVGMEKLELADGRVRKAMPDLYIDLSALAKGYAVDRLAAMLEQRACADYMVDIGGEIRVAGAAASGEPWRIGIEVPDPGQLGTLQTVLQLSDLSIATSGDYRNFRMIDGRRVDHVLDPRSGRPADNDVVSATVLHASAMWADAYATTLMVLGMEAGLAFAEREGIAAYIMARQPVANGAHRTDDNMAEDLFVARYNDAMRTYLPQSD